MAIRRYVLQRHRKEDFLTCNKEKHMKKAYIVMMMIMMIYLKFQ
jgi:hypothetical protein